jgi:hypothetical protein
MEWQGRAKDGMAIYRQMALTGQKWIPGPSPGPLTSEEWAKLTTTTYQLLIAMIALSEIEFGRLPSQPGCDIP